MKTKLFLIVMLLFASPIIAQIPTMDGDSILCWEVNFWQLNDVYTEGFEVNQGDMISIQWKQPLGSSDLDQWWTDFGDTSGLVVSLRLYTADVSYAGLDTVNVVYEDYILSLIPGVWAISVRAGDMALNFSSWCEPIWIIVKPAPDMPPLLPVELRIQIIKLEEE